MLHVKEDVREILEKLQPLFDAFKQQRHRELDELEKIEYARNWLNSSSGFVCTICNTVENLENEDSVEIHMRYHEWLEGSCWGGHSTADHAEIGICFNCFLQGWTFPSNSKYGAPHMHNLLTGDSKVIHGLCI